MTDAFSAMQYPHWLLVAGAILVVLGFIGLAFRQRKDAEVELTEMANEAEPAQTQTNRKAKLAEQTRDRWANKDRGTKEEPLDDRPQLSGTSNRNDRAGEQQRAAASEVPRPINKQPRNTPEIGKGCTDMGTY